MSSERTNNTNSNRSNNRNRNNNQGRRNNNRRPNNRNGKQYRGNRKPAPKLTWWQKLLQAIGLYKAPKKQVAKKAPNKKGTTPSPNNKDQEKKRTKQAPPQQVSSNRLYVGNLSYDVSETDLIDLFKGFGDVRKAEVVYNNRTHRSKGFAFVEMVSVDDAKRSVEVLHEQPFMGRNLIVNGARTKQDEDAQPVSEEKEATA